MIYKGKVEGANGELGSGHACSGYQIVHVPAETVRLKRGDGPTRRISLCRIIQPYLTNDED
jgi:hypothetical protein